MAETTSLEPRSNVSRPPSDYWTLTMEPQPNCIDQNAHVLAAGIINTCTDLLVVCFPLPTVLKLRLPRRQVILVSILFAAGGIVCVAGGARTYYTYLETSGIDSTWAAFPVWLSGSVELYIGMVQQKSRQLVNEVTNYSSRSVLLFLRLSLFSNATFHDFLTLGSHLAISNQTHIQAFPDRPNTLTQKASSGRLTMLRLS